MRHSILTDSMLTLVILAVKSAFRELVLVKQRPDE